MPPKAPESKAAKAAKAMAGGKKKAKVRARDGEARSAETLKTNDDGTRASRGVGADARGAAIGTGERTAVGILMRPGRASRSIERDRGRRARRDDGAGRARAIDARTED